jgi:hypothetical protein
MIFAMATSKRGRPSKKPPRPARTAAQTITIVERFQRRRTTVRFDWPITMHATS